MKIRTASFPSIEDSKLNEIDAIYSEMIKPYVHHLW